jgi:hypothetical protein
VRPLHQTLLASCKAMGVAVLTYTWERWQLCCKLHELLFLEAVRGAGGPSTALDEVLPCASHVDDWCVANLVRGGCDPAAAVAIVADLGRTAADAAVELTARLVARSLVRLVARSAARSMQAQTLTLQC